MKILIYKGDYDLVKQSGVGQAIEHQEKALKLNNIDYTTDENDDYDIVHINTIMPKSKKFAKKAKKQGKKLFIMVILLWKILEILFVERIF